MTKNTNKEEKNAELLKLKEEKKRLREERRQRKLEIQKEREAKKESNPVNEDNFYCTNKSLLAEMIKWRDSATDPEDRIISEDLGKMIMMIATKMTNHSNFRNYSQDLKQEMISYACFKMIQGLPNYDFNFKNPFAYMSSAAYNANITICTKYYKQMNIKKELLKKKLLELEIEGEVDSRYIYNTFIKKYLGEDEEDSE